MAIRKSLRGWDSEDSSAWLSDIRFHVAPPLVVLSNREDDQLPSGVQIAKPLRSLVKTSEPTLELTLEHLSIPTSVMSCPELLTR